MSDRFPSFYNFLNPDRDPYLAGYGFPIHSWDQPEGEEGTIKIGTLSARDIKESSESSKRKIVDPDDQRVMDARKYVEDYLNGVEVKPVQNYACPMIFYDGRETVLDKINRKDDTLVVQSGGWVGKYYPYLGKAAYRLLFDREFQTLRSHSGKEVNET